MRRVSCDGLRGRLVQSMSSFNAAGSTTEPQVKALSTWLSDQRPVPGTQRCPRKGNATVVRKEGRSQLKSGSEDMSCALIMMIHYLVDGVSRE